MEKMCRNCAHFDVVLGMSKTDPRGICRKTFHHSMGKKIPRRISFLVANWATTCPKHKMKDEKLQVAEVLAGVWDNMEYVPF